MHDAHPHKCGGTAWGRAGLERRRAETHLSAVLLFKICLTSSEFCVMILHSSMYFRFFTAWSVFSMLLKPSNASKKYEYLRERGSWLVG